MPSSLRKRPKRTASLQITPVKAVSLAALLQNFGGNKIIFIGKGKKYC